MKTVPMILILSAFATLASCSSDSSSTGAEEHLAGQLDTARVDYKGDAPQTIFYDFSRDSLTSIAQDSWDLAIATRTGAIRANGGLYGSGVFVYKTTHTSIDTDLSSLQDSVTQIQTTQHDPFQGEISREATGSGSVYLLRDAEGHYFKLQFASFGIQGKYRILLAKGLDAEASELQGSMTFAQGFVWLDLSSGTDVSARFPAAEEWDICFTRGLEQKQYAGPGVDSIVVAQSVIYLNAAQSVSASIAEKTEFDSIAGIQGADFTQAFDFIGAGWYDANYDPQTHISNPTVKDRVYLIQVGDTEVYKVKFLSFFGPQKESFYTVFLHEAIL